MNFILFDLESQTGPDDHPGKWEDKHRFGVACAGLYDSEDRRVKLYWSEHVEEMREFSGRLTRADYVIGFWHTEFDLVVLEHHLKSIGVEPPEVSKNINLRKVIGGAIDISNQGRRSSRIQSKGNNLQALLKANNLALKSDHGANAPGLFKERSIGRLLTYQADDIKAEYGLLRFLALNNWLTLACGSRIGCSLPEPFLSEYLAWLQVQKAAA